MIRRLAWVCVTLGLLVGCTSADPVGAGELQIVEAQAFEEEPLPIRYQLVARATGASVGPAPLDLWLPLPPSDGHQAVLTLVWEVAQPATVQGTPTNDAGDRMLHVRSPSGFPDVQVRASIELPVPQNGELPAALSTLSPSLAPAAWVSAARERGHPARLAQGITLGPDGAARDCEIPEIEVESVWVPVDVRAHRIGQPEGVVRLAPLAAHAKTAGEPVEVETTYTLERDD